LLPLVSQGGLKLKENICVDGQWRIERCPTNSTIQCFTLHKTIGLKCKTMINFYKSINGILIPCYSGFWVQYHNRSFKHHKHWFCSDDFNHCVGGTTWKFVVVQVRLIIVTICPIQKGIYLIQNEVTTLEEKWFSFDHLHRNNIRSLFGSQSFSLKHFPCVYWKLPQSCEVVWCKLLAYNSWWQEGDTAFCFQINIITLQ
jgi:hypothetical protein